MLNMFIKTVVFVYFVFNFVHNVGSESSLSRREMQFKWRLIKIRRVMVIVNKGQEETSKLMIDNDAGGDDAMAIFYALLFEKNFNGPQVIGLTTSNGNTNEDNVYHNNQRILKVAGRQEVPIYRGSKASLVFTPLANATYGKDGLGDSGDVVTDLVAARDQTAVLALIEMSKTYEGQLTVVTIGALTNVALAINIDPDFLKRLQHLYIGAGHIYSDSNSLPETNARTDAEAYKIVVNNASPDKVTVLPYSQTKASLNMSKAWRENVLGAIDSDIMRAQNVYERISLTRSDRWHALDPATVAMALRPDLVREYRYAKNNIILCGEKRGIVTNDFVDKDEANVRIIYWAKKEEYRQSLLDVFSSDLKNNSFVH